MEACSHHPNSLLSARLPLACTAAHSRPNLVRAGQPSPCSMFTFSTASNRSRSWAACSIAAWSGAESRHGRCADLRPGKLSQDRLAAPLLSVSQFPDSFPGYAQRKKLFGSRGKLWPRNQCFSRGAPTPPLTPPTMGFENSCSALGSGNEDIFWMEMAI